MFNSSLIYEIAVLKKHAVKLLKEVEDGGKYGYEKQRLLRFLEFFNEFNDESIIPNTSIIKEFIGGSCFRERTL
jgi:uridine kinase